MHEPTNDSDHTKPLLLWKEGRKLRKEIKKARQLRKRVRKGSKRRKEAKE